MSIEKLAPCSGAHAVQSAVFALEWSKPLTIDMLRELRLFYEKTDSFKKLFPVVQEQNQVSVRIDQSGGISEPSVTASGNELLGYQFLKRRSAVDVARLLQITKNNCLYVVHDYTRWKLILDDVMRALLSISHILTSNPISSVGLQYTDVFHWRDDPQSLKLEEFLDKDGGLFPPAALGRDNLWHSHHGFFEDRQNPEPHRLLENINLDIVDNSGQRSIAIVSSHKAQLQNEISSVESFSGRLNRLFEDLHLRNKDVLKKLLTKAVQEKINLK